MSLDIRNVLAFSDLFRPLPEAELRALAERTGVCRLERGALLFSQGEPAHAVYLVHRGQMRLSKLTPEGEQVIVSFLVAGEPFAVVAAMQETTYAVTAEAVRPTILLSWPKAVLTEAFRRHPDLSFRAVQVISSRMRELQDRFRELATLPVGPRLARALLRLADQCGRPTNDGIRLELRLTRQDLAELTGTTLYTVSRLVSAWRTQGILATRREQMTVADPERLAGLAENPLPHA